MITFQEAHRGHRSRNHDQDREKDGEEKRERHRRKKRSERPTSLTHQKMQNDYEEGFGS